jgi:RNA polymerase sigma factor (sigma-70 family)
MWSVTMNDEELHERIILLDPVALDAWAANVRPAILGWLVRGGLSIADAEEVWNDAFAATINAAPALEPRGISLRRYAFRVARNLRADRMEAAARLVTTPLDEQLETANPNPARALPDGRRVAALLECLERCPERYRLVIELAQSGSDTNALARLLGIDVGSVYQVRRRARLWLQRCVEERVR